MLNKLSDYLAENKLIMNKMKTKTMTFFKGRVPDLDKRPFFVEGVELEEVKEFEYLGVIFTPQLAYSKHLEKTNAKARSKIGQVFSMTPIENVDVSLAEELFKVYIQPVYDYCSAIWTTNVSTAAKENMNRVHLKFWKRYLQVPKCASKNITYLVTNTIPLTQKMFKNPTKALESINLSIQLEGHQLYLVKEKPPQEEEYSFDKEVPEQFWNILKSQHKLPTDINLRKRFTSKLFDLKHKYLCNRPSKEFHNNAEVLKCKCKNCNDSLDWYHECQANLNQRVAS